MTEETQAIESASPPDPAPVEEKPVETVEPDPNVTANGEKLDRQTRNWRALERDRDHWREVALQHLKPQQESPPAPKEPEKVKTLADFNYDEAEYAAYVRTGSAAEAVKAARAEIEKAAAERERQKRQDAFAARERDFAKKNPDYMEVTRDASVPISTELAAAIIESDDGPELAYYLAKNVEVAEALVNLPERALAREIGRIEARLAYERKAAEEAKKRVSRAPAPPPTLDGVDATVDVQPGQPGAEKLDGDVWLKRREKQVRNRNR